VRRAASYIQQAAELGLGIGNLDDIRLREVALLASARRIPSVPPLRRRPSSLLPTWLVAIAALGGCTAAGPPKQPPGLPPAPETVTLKEPGGDAENPEIAAIDRLGVEAWGPRVDRRDSVLVPHPDPNNWKRVKFKLIPSWTGFRYGDKHHGISTLYMRPSPVPGEPTSEQCIIDFEKWGRELANKFEAKLTDADTTKIRWQGKDITVRAREGSATILFYGTRAYAVTYAAYPVWGGCAVLGYGFPMKESAEAAKRTRDRFAKEAFQQFGVKKKDKPPD
jgi:hypothetical protein